MKEKISKKVSLFFTVFVLLFTLNTNASATSFILSKLFGISYSNYDENTAKEDLGKKLYFDKNLSEPNGQSCASCHTPSAGFADPDNWIPVSEGVIDGLFGGRNSPSAAYAMFVPKFHFDETEELFKGGLFWDGRATGDELGDPLSHQALGPFLNPVEMANPNKMTVVRDAKNSNYSDLFNEVCGDVDLSNEDEVNKAYECIASSIGKFERTDRFGKFSSKYDRYLKRCVSIAGSSDKALDACAKGTSSASRFAAYFTLTRNEWKGLKLFMGENNNDGVMQRGEGAMCAACHTADWTNTSDYELSVVTPSWAPKGKVPPIFTDHTYDNLGIPKNPYSLTINNPIDLGLGAFKEGYDGNFRVLSLRNIGDTSPYGHNGLFENLYDIVHFYNSRDVESLGEAEVPSTMNTDELGNLGLSYEQEMQLVQFLKTLSD